MVGAVDSLQQQIPRFARDDRSGTSSPGLIGRFRTGKRPETHYPCGVPAIFRRCLGGDEGDRTLDLGIANAALSQLSYVPGSRVF